MTVVSGDGVKKENEISSHCLGPLFTLFLVSRDLLIVAASVWNGPFPKQRMQPVTRHSCLSLLPTISVPELSTGYVVCTICRPDLHVFFFDIENTPQQVKINHSCEIEDFVETSCLQAVCGTAIARVTGSVCPHEG